MSKKLNILLLMMSLAHTLISLPFGVFLENPIIIFVAAFLFHLFSDTLLHWNFYEHHKPFYPLVAFDVTAGLLLAYIIMGDQVITIPILAAIAGGNAPDIVHSLWDMAGKTRQKKLPKAIQRFFIFHNKLQHETPYVLRGLLSQIILIVAAVMLIT